MEENTNQRGRPVKYDPSMCQQIEDYLKTCGREQTKLPKRVDVALMLGVDDETLIEWEKKYPDFSATIKKVDQSQLAELQDDGLFGGKEVNANVAIFLMKANHGLIETSRTDITSGNKPITPLIDISSHDLPKNDSNQENTPVK